MTARARLLGEKFEDYHHNLQAEERELKVRLRGKNVYQAVDFIPTPNPQFLSFVLTPLQEPHLWGPRSRGPARVNFRRHADPTLSPTDRYYAQRSA